MASDNSSSLQLDRLESYLGEQLGGAYRNLTAKEFAGGASNPTFLLESDSESIVLRSKPFGKLAAKAHAIDREYRVLNALGNTDFPVPKTFFYCDNTDVIGAEFYVMEYVQGRVMEDYTIPESSPSERAAIYDSMNAAMAQLHRINPDDIGLADYGKPGNYFERQIAIWMRGYEQQEESLPRFEELASWLTHNMIRDERRSIVHGDYQLANILLAPDAPNVVAVLDWELSTTGHPLADFTYNLSQWYLPNLNTQFGKVTLVDADLNALGIPSIEAYVERYADRSGIQISNKDLYYGIAFNLYRLAGIVIGIMGRAKAGTAKNEFARSSDHNLEPFINLALEYVGKAEAS